MTTADLRRLQSSLLLAAGVFAVVQLFHWIFPSVLDLWNEQLNDKFLSLKASSVSFQVPYDDSLVFVDLNNTSLRALKDYHPSRRHHARAIRNLAEMNVALIMYDFIFAGKSDEEIDRQLIDATMLARSIIYGMAFRLSPVPQPPNSASEDTDEADLKYLDETTWKIKTAEALPRLDYGVSPIITLTGVSELSLGTGFLTLTPDRDGVIRRLPLAVRYKDGFYPSFALKAVCEFLKVPAGNIILGPHSLTLLQATHPGTFSKKDIVIPLDPNGFMRINFAGPWGRMQHYNFSDIFFASDDPGRMELWQDELHGKIVLVSDISTGSADMGQVPVDELYPLSGVHANSVNTILTGSFVHDLGWPWVAAIELILISAVTALSAHRSAVVFSLGSLGLAAGLFSAAGISILLGNLLIPVIKPLLILFLVWAGLSTLNAVRNARTQAEIERARRVAERELEIGRKIQAGFLPARLPNPAGWQIAAYFRPALQVSGDFYDVFELAGGRCLGIVIADVCDHGVGSALFMALSRSLIRAFALQNADRLAVRPGEAAGWSHALALDTVRQTNAYIADNHGDAGMFATLFLGILDPDSGSLTYVNGGHEPPLFLRHGRDPVYLKATGLAVGALSESAYTSKVIQFEPGDRLILYTDGLTDAEGEAAAHFSKERLVRLVSEDTADAQSAVDRVIRALNSHVGSGSPADDVTLVFLYRSHSSFS